jgi:hypothetical protein
MEPCKIRATTQPLVSRTGAGRQGNIFSFQSRDKNVLDFSSYFAPTKVLSAPILWATFRYLQTANVDARRYWR